MAIGAILPQGRRWPRTGRLERRFRMTFLQPFILWGLPLILLPVLIHLFNRLRHRSMPWAAMMFLRSATRKSTRYARLRQFLILLFRVLAVFGLLLALSRPLAGGWAGWLFASAPDVILVLLDRSASMETKNIGNQSTKREEAIKVFSDAAKGFEETSRLMLLENTAASPQEVAGAASLPEMSSGLATDTAADLPAMLQSALDWFAQNKPGSGEIWIASDLQQSNWQPESDRWPALASGLAALPQGVRLRLLALNHEPEANLSVSVLESNRRQVAGQAELELLLEVQRNGTSPLTLPLTTVVDGVPSQVELRLEGQSLRYRHKVFLSDKNSSGWGYVELPADANLRDNRSYFVYGPVPVLRAALVSTDEQSRRILQAAVSPDPRNTNRTCEVIAPNGAGTAAWNEFALVVWQGPLPQGETATQLQGYVEGGGVLLFFPSGESGPFAGGGWSEVQTATPDNAFRIRKWEEQDGPLAKTDEGLSLPLSEVAFSRRQVIVGEKTALASFEDGTPFLTRRGVGQGQVLFCAALPNKDWSGLHEGDVLVPLLHRLLETGGRRLTQASAVACGDAPRGSEPERWSPVDSAPGQDARTQSGVYRNQARLIAVNRPAREDEREVVEAAKAKMLLGRVPIQLFDEQRQGTARIQSELWRIFLFAMALFLLVEAFLILPDRSGNQSRDQGVSPDRARPTPARRSTEVST